jgi:hypothetical protein
LNLPEYRDVRHAHLVGEHERFVAQERQEFVEAAAQFLLQERHGFTRQALGFGCAADQARKDNAGERPHEKRKQARQLSYRVLLVFGGPAKRHAVPVQGLVRPIFHEALAIRRFRVAGEQRGRRSEFFEASYDAARVVNFLSLDFEDRHFSRCRVPFPEVLWVLRLDEFERDVFDLQRTCRLFDERRQARSIECDFHLCFPLPAASRRYDATPVPAQ